MWNFWKKLKFYIADISQKSCVFKWIFKKMILKIFYDVIFLEKIFKSRILKNSTSEIFFKKLKSLVFMCILWEYKPNFGHFFSTFSPAQDRCDTVLGSLTVHIFTKISGHHSHELFFLWLCVVKWWIISFRRTS